MTDQTTTETQNPNHSTIEDPSGGPAAPDKPADVGMSNPFFPTFARAVREELAWLKRFSDGPEGEKLTIAERADLVIRAADIKLRVAIAATQTQLQGASLMVQQMQGQKAAAGPTQADVDDALARMRRQRGGK